MYKILTIKTNVQVPPAKFGLKFKDSIKESIGLQFEGKITKELGVGLVVTDIHEIGEGKILPENPNINYPIKFDLLTYKPEQHEIVQGEVIDNTEFGAFVRFGPMDGLVHVSQLVNDYISFDDKNSIFTGKESKKTLKVGDAVRTRVISLSMSTGKENKVGLTMRQPGLGALSWIEQEKAQAKKASTGAKK